MALIITMEAKTRNRTFAPNIVVIVFRMLGLRCIKKMGETSPKIKALKIKDKQPKNYAFRSPKNLRHFFFLS